MIPYGIYKLIHFTGVFLVLLGLGGLIAKAAKGDGREHPWHKTASMSHGIGLLLALIGGLGLLVQPQVAAQWPWPGWVFAKLLIWLALGGIVALVARKPKMAKAYWWVTLILAAAAAYLATQKPF